MYFSCKISNAVLSYLENRGGNLDVLYEQSRFPLELLKDSSRWLTAPDMESFLDMALQVAMTPPNTDQVLTMAGHEGPLLRAWGVLDSVLKMMPRPQEILNQPESFLSYFIAPKPPVENVQRDENGISFDLPLPAEQYPLVTTYLKAAFESLPLYVGQTLARCEWKNITLQIHWSHQQKSMFSAELGHQVSPTLIQDIISDLQSNQLNLEEERRSRTDLDEKIIEQEKTILILRNQIEQLQSAGGARASGTENEGVLAVSDSTSAASAVNPLITEMDHLLRSVGGPRSLVPSTYSGYHLIEQNLARLHDYMVRAQQLIMVITAESALTPAVKKAMRKLDWEFVKSQYPRAVAESMETLRRLQEPTRRQMNVPHGEEEVQMN